MSHFHFEHFELVPALRQVRVNGQVVPLGGRAYDLLLVLIEHRDQVVGKDELLTRVWPGQVVEENNLTVQIAALRKAIGAEAVATVSGRGYRFTARELPETSTAAASPAWISANALERPTLALPNIPSIAVLPFENLSGDPSQDYFADGMVEDIITALARMKAFFVIARNSSGEGNTHLLNDRPELALAAGKRAIEESPNYPVGHRVVTAALGFLGRWDEARVVAARLLELSPRFTVSSYESRVPYRSAEFRARMATVYRAAGLPA